MRNRKIGRLRRGRGHRRGRGDWDRSGLEQTDVSGPGRRSHDDQGLGPTTLARGEDVELKGESNLVARRPDAEHRRPRRNGKVTGEFRVTENVIGVECAETPTKAWSSSAAR